MIKNKTRDTTIIEDKKLITSILSKAIGLMFSKKQKKALIFIFDREKIVPLHNCFVFYPIDILFLDKNKKVVEKKESFRPFSFYTPKNRSKYVIELPEKTIKNSKTEINDLIEF